MNRDGSRRRGRRGIHAAAVAAMLVASAACTTTTTCPRDEGWDGTECARLCNNAGDCRLAQACNDGYCRAVSVDAGVPSSSGRAPASSRERSSSTGASGSGPARSSSAAPGSSASEPVPSSSSLPVSGAASGGSSSDGVQVSSAAAPSSRPGSSSSPPGSSSSSAGSSSSQPGSASSASSGPSTSSTSASGPAPAIVGLGAWSTSSSGSTLLGTLGNTAGARVGDVVVVVAAGRGGGPITLSDTPGNTWTVAVQQPNSGGVASVAVFYSVLTHALGNGDTFSADFVTTSNYTRSLWVGRLDGATALDAAGGAQPVCSAVSVSTSAPLAGEMAWMIATVATGFNQAQVFHPAGGFTVVHEYSGTLSSGADATRIAGWLRGTTPTFTTSDPTHVGNCAAALAVFR